MSAEEKRSFLEDPAEDEVGNGKIANPRKRETARILQISLVANAILLVVCALLSGTTIGALRFGTKEACPSSTGRKELAEPFSPANAVIEYEYRSVQGNDSRFTGYPGAEWEKSWHELMNGTLIKLSKEEIEMHGSDSIPLKDGGYAGAIGVGHNLHCVKKMKQYLYREHFFPDLDPNGPEMTRHRDHADHCLDWIRQGMMCYVDPSMYTMWWEQPNNPTHKLPGVQKCVNWNALHDWMKSRATTKDSLVRMEDMR